jgi:hypothetical protein
MYSGSGKESVPGSFEHGNELSGSIRGGEFLDYQKVKGKDKFVPVLFLTEHHAMKAFWGTEL